MIGVTTGDADAPWYCTWGSSEEGLAVLLLALEWVKSGDDVEGDCCVAMIGGLAVCTCVDVVTRPAAPAC